jgi:hypothetical protein
MAKPSQHSSGSSSGGVGGAGQAVVELRAASAQGLIFWSRQRFEVGTELQVRLRAAALPEVLRAGAGSMGEWASLRGFVVQCSAERREDGSCGFQVSMLVAGRPEAIGGVEGARPGLFFSHEWLGGWRLGVN